MELRLESLVEETDIIQNDSTFSDNELQQKDVPIFKYFTREAMILPINERTVKKQLDKAAEEETRRRMLETAKLQELEEKLKMTEFNNEKKKIKEEEEIRKKITERFQIEENEQLEKMVGLKEWEFRTAFTEFLQLGTQTSIFVGF